MKDTAPRRPHYTPPKPGLSTRTQKHPSAPAIVARKHASGNAQLTNPEAPFRTFDEPNEFYL